MFYHDNWLYVNWLTLKKVRVERCRDLKLYQEGSTPLPLQHTWDGIKENHIAVGRLWLRAFYLGYWLFCDFSALWPLLQKADAILIPPALAVPNWRDSQCFFGTDALWPRSTILGSMHGCQKTFWTSAYVSYIDKLMCHMGFHRGHCRVY